MGLESGEHVAGIRTFAYGLTGGGTLSLHGNSE